MNIQTSTPGKRWISGYTISVHVHRFCRWFCVVLMSTTMSDTATAAAGAPAAPTESRLASVDSTLTSVIAQLEAEQNLKKVSVHLPPLRWVRGCLTTGSKSVKRWSPSRTSLDLLRLS